MTIKATYVKNLKNFTGSAALWRLSEPVKVSVYDENIPVDELHYFAASAVNDPSLGVHETYLFATDHIGNVLSWVELPGSMRGTTHHWDAVDGLLAYLNDN